MRFALPLAFFLGLAALLGWGLGRDPSALPSALLDQPAPAIDLPTLHDPQRRLQVDSLRGQVWLLNVWASWCAPCSEELPVLSDLAARDGVPLYGLNYKDQREAALAILRERGNPYLASAVDSEGRIGIDYGVYRVPETFVIDRSGRIRYKHLGVVTQEVWTQRLMPVVRSLQ
jgi:cytochrome c biogenesis protein CcmG/thiol:disulfide interchange protein DsbE